MYFIIVGSVKDAIERSRGLSTHIAKRRMYVCEKGVFSILDQIHASATRLPVIEFNQEDSEHIIAVLKLTDCINTALQDYVDLIRNQPI